MLHKLYGNDWKQQLDDYVTQNPNVLIIDSPEVISQLHNRILMLQVVSEINVEETDTASFQILRQVIMYETASGWWPVAARNPQNVARVQSRRVEEAQPPIVLQEFVNHEGVIFKYYKMMNLEDAEIPPECLVNDIARRAMKLHLFNFDVIVDGYKGTL
ncbi:hypothetical protein RJ640_027512 [Escallonia rubra]|uniref:Uncharacterized protein n=1 Tax=Escallonia rubra TaxID=112253 RepID=A0AA88QRQ0_9ASTE|nr:hypothetical protein RJ640_027512 [Escallonia rubra]